MSKELLFVGDSQVSVNPEGLISLTDLWKAAGGGVNQRPVIWIRNEENAQFIAEVARKEKVIPNHLFQVTRGRNGGTFAHWQIALAYAKYLSPELHMKVNEVFMRYKSGDASLAEEVIEKVRSPEDLLRIEVRARGVRANKELNKAIASCGGFQKTFAFVADNNNLAVTGKRARQLREENNLPVKASTRSILSNQDMVIMAFLEDLECSSLRGNPVVGHQSVVNRCGEVADSVSELVAKYTKCRAA